MKSPFIQFNRYIITNIDYKLLDEPTLDEDGELSLSAFIGVSEDKKTADIKLTGVIADHVKNRSVTVEILGLFDLDMEGSVKEIKDFLSVNGTAILFPYLRSIVSIVSSLDGDNSIILPTINTTGFVSE